MSTTITLVNNESFNAPDNPAIDLFFSSFGTWQVNEDTGALQFVPNSSPPLFVNIGSERVQNPDLIVNLENFIDNPPYYETKLTVRGTTSTNINIEEYVKLGTRYAYYATKFQAPDLFSDIRNRNANSDEPESFPATDIQFDYEIENIEYEDLVTTAPNEYALLNYYEPIENNLLHKNDAAVLLTDSLDSPEFTKTVYANVIVPPEAIDAMHTNNSFSPDERIPNIGLTEAVQDAPGGSSFANTTYMEQIPLVSRIKIQNLETQFQGPFPGDILDKRFIANNLMFFTRRQNADGVSYRPYDTYDLGSNLMRWHATGRELLDENRTFIYTRNVVNADLTETTVNSIQNMYSYDLLEWCNNYAPTILDRDPEDLSVVTDPTNFKFSTMGTDCPSTYMALDNYGDGGYQLATALDIFIENYLADAGASTGFIDAQPFLQYKDLAPSIAEVLQGDVGTSETLFFRVAKYEGTPPQDIEGTPIQNFYIPADKSSSLFKYLDTQVYYNKEYTYRIYAVKAVAGCEYEYISAENITDNDIYTGAPDVFEVVVRSYPKVKVIEFPIFEKTNKILAQPPLPPTFNFVPIQRTQNKFKLIFGSNYGIERMLPTTMTDNDASNIEYIQNNSYTPASGMVEYTDISTVTDFAIFQSDIRPFDLVNYSEFQGGFFGSVNTDIDPNSKLLADSAATILNLIPNKKYYFTFVARNRLGLTSNPTRVFEVELVNDGGLSYPVVRLVTDDSYGDVLKPAKTLTKVVTIRPNFAQVQPDYLASGLVDGEGNPLESKTAELTLGLGEETMFGAPGTGKKFKLRFKSKKTNRMFDINITCKNTKVPTEFQQIAEPEAVVDVQTDRPDGFIDPNAQVEIPDQTNENDPNPPEPPVPAIPRNRHSDVIITPSGPVDAEDLAAQTAEVIQSNLEGDVRDALTNAMGGGTVQDSAGMIDIESYFPPD